MTDTGLDLIAAERRRQVEVEGYTSDHDAEHGSDALARAAACYATPAQARPLTSITRLWPWHPVDWKPMPGDRRRELVKAGALIAAALDALERG